MPERGKGLQQKTVFFFSGRTYNGNELIIPEVTGMENKKDTFNEIPAVMELADDKLDQVSGGQTIPPLSDLPHQFRSTEEIRCKSNSGNRPSLGSTSVDDILQERKKQASQQSEPTKNRVVLSTLINSQESDFGTETIGRNQPTPPATLGVLDIDRQLGLLGGM